MTRPARPLILHLAVDVNTPQRPRTTTAVEWFVEALAEFDNVVIGLRRTPRPWGLTVSDCGQVRSVRLYDLPFFGLPAGVGLYTAMRLAARRTIRLLERDGLRPQIVHAHKLTFEGMAGWFVARHFGVPLFVSLRGEVETKIFRFKPTYRPFLARICRDAARLYFVSAWFRPLLHDHVGAMPAKERLFPNIVRNVSREIRTRPAGPAFVAVLNLDTWRRKGVRWLLDGFARAAAEAPAMRLEIIGGGSARSTARVAAMIAANGLADRVTMVGPLANAELLRRLPGYRGLLLPSLNETFGMVYVEALFAGIPILFTERTAIDGYLDGLNVGRAVPPKDPAAIAAAILDLWRRTDELRTAIRASADRLFDIFDPETNLAFYRGGVQAALSPEPGA